MNKIFLTNCFLLVFIVGCLLAGTRSDTVSQAPASSEWQKYTFTTQLAKGLGSTEGVNRRDPSDIIKIGQRYYLFYTMLQRGDPVYPEGYFGTIWYATSKDEGHTWTEQGCAIPKGAKGKFDSFGAFTPNVVKGIDGEYYLYYTGVGDEFDNRRNDYSEKNRTAIGAARLFFDKKGNIIGLVKLNDGDPILLPSSAESGKFDSFRADDAALVIREGKYWLYYKGRRYQGTPGQTKMGLAIASKPQGPYNKQHDGNPVQYEGHEVMVWPYGEGVVSVVSNVGRGIYYARDGIHFEKVAQDFIGRINAPGAFRPDLTDHACRQGAPWGISMVHARDPYLIR
jgi:hypothetical protein